MTESTKQLLYDGVMALGAGNRARAQQLLLRVIELDERHELGWLWLSGAVDDPADQQVALENVLAINPSNEAAQRGLEQLRAAGTATSPAETQGSDDWVPPPPYIPQDNEELVCWQCQSTIYTQAEYCFQCHAPVHSCKNCQLLPEPRCKQLQGLVRLPAQQGRNSCPWWHPATR
jgi:hypothetical protein